MKCKYEGNDAWEGRCLGTREIDPCVGYENCKRYRPDCLTNADRIRAMSDEELARVMVMCCVDCIAKPCKLHNHSSYDCREHIKNWLRQPVKEVVDGV